MARPLTAGRVVAKLAMVLALFGLTLLVPAGTWRWPAAWAYAGVYLAFAIPVGVWLFRTNPALLAQRIDWTKRAPKAWDRALMAGLVPAFVAQYVVAGLDYRFGWSHLPTALRVDAFGLVAAFYVLLFLVLRENAFLSRVVEVNPQADHRVVTPGPYAWVRHPHVLRLRRLGAGGGHCAGLAARARAGLPHCRQASSSGPSSKTARCRRSCPATPTTPRACAGGSRAATHQVFRSARYPSHVVLPVVVAAAPPGND